MLPDAVLMTPGGDDSAPETTETELVAQSRNGHVKAFESLYRRHIGRIYGLCLRMTGNPHTAEECAQEAFVRAWQNLQTFKGDSEFGTWLYRIAVNQVLTHHRKQRRHGMHLVEGNPEDHQIAGAPAQADAGIDLEAAIAQLPERARHIFVLQCIYGHSHEEVAQMLDVAVGTTKAQVHRAKQLLGRYLDE